jgi:hypothetical protein
MRRTLFSLMVAGVLLLGSVATAPAQGSGTTTLVNVPFSFIVSGKVLPAGAYRITVGGDLMTVLVESNDGKRAAAFAPVVAAANPSANAADAQVSFKTYAGQHFLWMVNTPDSDSRELILQRPEMDRMLARLNLLPPERADIPAK